MKRKNIIVAFLIGGLSILTTFVWILWTQKKGRVEQDNFLKKEFSSIVVKSNSYYGRTVEFHLENGFTLYFSPPIKNKIMVGDSVTKKGGTYKYHVYRKNINNEFEYFASYEGDDVQ